MSNIEQVDAPTQTKFEIQRLYIKEKSCKVPHAPAIFQDEWKPDIQMEMSIKHEKIAATAYEVVLKLTLTGKNEQRTAFLLEVQQAGIFTLEHFTEEQINLILQIHCPNILYPYARKVIADATMDAGFPPLTIAPINFEALYQQQQQAQQQKQQQSTTKETIN